MRFESQVKAKFNTVSSVEKFLRIAKTANQDNLVIFEGQSVSGGSLFLMSNGTQFHYSCVDRSGIKEGWQCDTISMSGAKKKIESLKRY
jgi:hypothetical protein